MFPKIPFSSIIVCALVLPAGAPITFDAGISGHGSALLAQSMPKDIRRIQQELEALTPELMRKHGVVGAQIHLFGAGDRSLAFGHEDAERENAVTPGTLFQAADLVRPLTAYLLLGELQSRAAGRGVDFQTALRAPLPPLADFPLEGLAEFAGRDAGVSAYELLTMTSGLPASRDGLLRGELDRPNPDDYLRERLALTHAPGDLFAIAPESYAYASKVLEDLSEDEYETQLRRTLRQAFGIQSACVNRENCPPGLRSADGTVHSGSYVFPLKPPHVLYPAADSLWISAPDYARFLGGAIARSKNDPAAAALFRPVHRADPELGGRAMGFQVLQGDAGGVLLYTSEGRLPGFSSYAFVTPEGRGAVLFCNSNERFFIREMVSYFYDRFGVLEKSPPAPDAATLDRARELEGSYRARETVPARERLFSFLTDVRIRAGARTIDFGGVFQKEAGVQLYPIGPDLYLARGPVTMDGWRVKVRRDADGEVVGLDSDLVRYERVHPLVSAWAILMYLGMLTSLPVLFFMLFIIRRRSAGPGAEADDAGRAGSVSA
ncbi:MAG: serine hydrolase [Leptospirales bacterium]